MGCCGVDAVILVAPLCLFLLFLTRHGGLDIGMHGTIIAARMSQSVVRHSGFRIFGIDPTPIRPFAEVRFLALGG